MSRAFTQLPVPVSGQLRRLACGLLLGSVLGLTGCASVGSGKGVAAGVQDGMPTAGAALAAAPSAPGSGLAMPANPQDPLESYNRAMYRFNDVADRYALKPVARAYDFVVPGAVRMMVSNFFSNLGDVYSSANNLLQWKPKAALSDLTRFVVNSSFGFLGVADVASEIGLRKQQEDFGQTLGYWGVPSGPYFVLPLFGPSTIRDAAARPVDRLGSYFGRLEDRGLANRMFLTEQISERAALLQAEKMLDSVALDRYSLIRDGYLQRRRNQVYDGSPPDEGFYGDDPYADDPYLDDPTRDEPASDESTAGPGQGGQAAGDEGGLAM